LQLKCLNKAASRLFISSNHLADGIVQLTAYISPLNGSKPHAQ